MKKAIALILGCVMLFSVAFAFPINTIIMPRTGFINKEVKLGGGESWTSPKYEVPGAYDYVYLEVDWIEGGEMTVELYGSNSLNGAGVKVGTVSATETNNLSARRNYSYYHLKATNPSKTKSTCVVMLYA